MSNVEVRSMIPLRRELLNVRSRFRRDISWSTYGSLVRSYESTFVEVLGDRKLADLLRQKPHPTVIDLMAPSDTLADLFVQLPQSGKLGIVLSLEDLRSDSTKERDEALGIKQVSGDITRPGIWKDLRLELKGRKADLIMERAMGGLNNLPKDKRFYSYALANLWNMLDTNGGILLLQTPLVKLRLDGEVLAWVNLLKSQGIIAEFYDECLKLVRTPESPRDLPSAVSLPDNFLVDADELSELEINCIKDLGTSIQPNKDISKIMDPNIIINSETNANVNFSQKDLIRALK